MNPDNDDHLMLAAYLDGELSPCETIEMERKLATDPVLRQLRDRMRVLSGSVHQVLSEAPVPADLGARAAERFGNVEVLSSPRQEPRRWPSIAAALLIACSAGEGSAVAYRTSGTHKTTTERWTPSMPDISAASASQPFDIASSDRHIVKPWFNGRTAIAPDAPDFAAQAFPLAGGGSISSMAKRSRRSSSVDGNTSSASPSSRRLKLHTPPPRSEGTNIERWDAGDLSYVVVSDLNGTELREFANLFRSRMTPRP